MKVDIEDCLTVLLVVLLQCFAIHGSQPFDECQPDQFRCRNNLCIPKTSVCDDLPDCHDEDDEEDCDHFSQDVCVEGDKCDTVRECIEPSWRCDGKKDCSDASDETYCGKKKTTCAEDEIPCTSEPTFCIPSGWRCDNTAQCPDESDEQNCPRKCGATEFRCNNDLCLTMAWRCDNMDDCGDNSDEINCETTQVKCPEHEYMCTNGEECVSIEVVCDTQIDCSDGSDEGSACDDLSICEYPNSNCSQICVGSPRGAICQCSEGYLLASDNVTCNVPDACRDGGDKICSQSCENLDTGYRCICSDGYTLNKDTNTCSLIGRPPLLLFASDTVIASFNMSARLRKIIKKNLRNVYDIAYDDGSESVFWIDIRSKTINGGSIHDDSSRTIVTFGLQHPEGIHIDWISRKLYIIDSGRREVIVCTLNGHMCSVLVSGLDKPSSIVTDPMNRVMYWTDAGQSAHIMKSSMDGERQRKIVENRRDGAVLRWPNAIYIDYVSERIYWLDIFVKSLQSVTFDGRDRRSILENSIGQYPFSLVVLEGRVIWSDSHRNIIRSATVKAGKQQYELLKNVNKPTGLAVSHPSMQPMGVNHCKDVWCDMCVLSEQNSYKCVCPIGSIESQTEQKCVELKQDYLLFSRQKDLVKVKLSYVGSLPTTVIKRKAWTQIFGLALIAGTEKLLYSDISRDLIAVTDLNDTRKDERVLISTGLGTVGEVMIMDSTRYMYWTDVQKHTLEVSQLDGKYRSTLISRKNDEIPYALGLCKKDRLLIYTDIGHYPKILKCHLDATKCVPIPTRVGQIYDIVVEQKNCDMYAIIKASNIHRLTSISIDGRRSHDLAENLASPEALTMLNNKLYWLEQYSGTYVLSIYNLNTRKRIQYLQSSDDVIVSGTVFDSNENVSDYENLPDEDKTPCLLAQNKHAQCTQLCFSLPKSESPPFKCGCENGKQLADDGVSCKIKIVCTKSQFACLNRDECIAENMVCDGTAQCKDSSDEIDCEKVVIGVKCRENELRCDDRQKCVDVKYKCDGRAQCDDKSDEKGCCTSTQFRCIADDTCIDQSKTCDHYPDCSDSADETLPSCSLCPDGKFRCANSKCIDLKLVCDRKSDCDDASDEGLECKRSCRAKPCDQNCTETPLGPLCQCSHGYMLESTGTTCRDIDECSQVEPLCMQHCVNTRGSYLCQCTPGYRLQTDGHSCQLMGDLQPTLLYSVTDAIVFMSPKGPEILTDIQGTAVVMDYNHDTKVLYWTSTSAKVMMMSLSSSKSTLLIRNKKPTQILPSISDPYGLAVDWMTSNIYVIDRGQGHVLLCNYNGTVCRVIVARSRDSQLQCVAVHPHRSFLFVSSGHKIDRMSLDGRNRMVIVYDNSMPINGLVIDYTTDRLYWTNRAKHIVETCTLDGSNRRTLTSKIRNPFSVDVFGGMAFVSDWKSNNVSDISTFKRLPPVTILNNLKDVLAVKVWHFLRQPKYTSPCRKLKCSHLCVGTKTGAVCLCPDEQEFIDATNKTCMNCSMYCPKGHKCVYHDEHHIRCTCPNKKCTDHIVMIKPPSEEAMVTDDKGHNYGWIAGVVIGVVIVVMIVVCLVMYLKKKQKTLDLIGMIRYRNPIFHSKTEECDELVTDLSFKNPGFDEHDINSNEIVKPATSSSSDSSTDSAFCSPRPRTKIVPSKKGSYKNFTSEYEY